MIILTYVRNAGVSGYLEFKLNVSSASKLESLQLKKNARAPFSRHAGKFMSIIGYDSRKLSYRRCWIVSIYCTEKQTESARRKRRWGVYPLRHWRQEYVTPTSNLEKKLRMLLQSFHSNSLHPPLRPGGVPCAPTEDYVFVPNSRPVWKLARLVSSQTGPKPNRPTSETGPDQESNRPTSQTSGVTIMETG
jgi:hypothetical protein